MALVACKECKAKISSDAEKCPMCGKSQQTNIGCLPTLAILFAVAWVLSQFTGGSGGSSSKTVAAAPAPSPPVSVESRIPGACRQLMKTRLHDPDSVEYLDLQFNVPVKNLGEGVFSTRQRVRAKNKLGAKVLATYECEIRVKADSYQLLSLQEVE